MRSDFHNLLAPRSKTKRLPFVSKVAMLAQGSGGRIAILVRNLGALANPITDELANVSICSLEHC